ncbi:hypothetical protein D3C83_134740 [compost metagenome]
MSAAALQVTLIWLGLTAVAVRPPGTAGACVSAKAAVTLFALSIVTTHAPPPAHAPPQPLKLKPAFGCAVSVTTVP